MKIIPLPKCHINFIITNNTLKAKNKVLYQFSRLFFPHIRVKNPERKNEHVDIKQALPMMNPIFQISQCPENFNFEKISERK